nr:YecA family protein [uncultured Rhodopila sp.]
MSLDELAHFLNSSSAPPGCMDLSELDGFLAGLVAGPEVVPREEWLAEIWDNEDPDYIDAEEQAAVEGAIFERYAAIETGLDSTQLHYTAILWQDEAGTTVAEDWAAGFMQAVSLRSEAWQPALADEDASVLLIPIASLAGMTLSESERGDALPDEALEALMQDSEQVLPVCVLGLRRFWRQNTPGGGMVRH